MTAGDQSVCTAAGSARPTRKQLDHRGPLSVDVSSAWYFTTTCAESHQPWTVGGAPRAPRDATCREVSLADAAEMILAEAREYHVRGRWRLALMLVMPDHLHFIVQVSGDGAHGVRPLPRMVGDFKRLLTVRHGLRFQRDFWDTRLRDEAQFAEKFAYICNNPVRKGLCQEARM